MSKGALYVSGAIVALILIKDGTAGTVIRNGANTIASFASGIKPLSNVA